MFAAAIADIVVQDSLYMDGRGTSSRPQHAIGNFLGPYIVGWAMVFLFKGLALPGLARPLRISYKFLLSVAVGSLPLERKKERKKDRKKETNKEQMKYINQERNKDRTKEGNEENKETKKERNKETLA